MTAEKRAAKKMGPMPVARELIPCSTGWHIRWGLNEGATGCDPTA